MAATERPQIYLISPAEVDLATFSDRLSRVLDSAEVACLRMALSTRDEDRLMRAGDLMREITHARDVALVIEDHGMLVERLGLDGVHLGDGARSIRHWRKTLGADAIVGAYCGASRHDGMTAAEIGADYVSFGPVGQSALGKGTIAEPDLFEWWSEMIEVPVVAEGAISENLIANLSEKTDFFGIGQEIWETGDPAAALGALLAAMA